VQRQEVLGLLWLAPRRFRESGTPAVWQHRLHCFVNPATLIVSGINVKEEKQNEKELPRRSLVKSLLWRVIGIVWTWIGAYIILLFVPPSKKTAAFIATLIVIYHHSTRMIMYYAYERIWASIQWGRSSVPHPMSAKEKLLWSVLTAAALAFIFFLLLYVHPMMKT
jgi:hypothetical protein